MTITDDKLRAIIAGQSILPSGEAGVIKSICQELLARRAGQTYWVRAEQSYASPTKERDEVTDVMVEAACKAHAPQWPGIDPEIKTFARRQMRAALTAALNARSK